MSFPKTDRKPTRRGIAIVIVLFMAAIFTMVSASIGSDAVQLLRRNTGSTLQKRANYCAYAALQSCLAEMDKVTSWDPTLAGGAYYTTWDPGETLTDVPMPGDPLSSYTVRVSNNSRGTLGDPYVDPDGTKVPVGLVYIKVNAKSTPAPGQYGRTYRNSIASLGFVGSVHWQHAILGTNNVTVSNSIIDSFYSSSTKVYPAGNSTRATVGTNGIEKSLAVVSASNIGGRVRWGPGGTEADALVTESNVTIDGWTAASDPAFAKKPNGWLYRVPRFKPPYNPDKATEVVNVTSGMTVTLTPGPYKSAVVHPGGKLILQTRRYDDATGQTATQYFFNDAVNVSGGTIELTALDTPVNASRTELYVGESFYATDGAQINPRKADALGAAAESRPGRLQIIFVGNGSPRSPQSMNISASNVHAVVCGPGLELNLVNNSHLFGGARAFSVNCTQSQIHWDRHLATDSRIRGQVAWTLKGLVQEGYEGELDMYDAADYYDAGYGAGDGGGDGGDGGDGGGS